MRGLRIPSKNVKRLCAFLPLHVANVSESYPTTYSLVNEDTNGDSLIFHFLPLRSLRRLSTLSRSNFCNTLDLGIPCSSQPTFL